MSRQSVSTLLFCLLALAVLLSTPRQLVGDGGEYFSMARVLYAGGDPGVPRHFWGYPLLAVPVLRALVPLKVDHLWSFALVNLALLTVAWWHAAARWPPGVRLALFASPVIWWLDKAHTEALTFSALIVAWATWRSAPWWALSWCGIATMQNPPLGVTLAGFAALSAWANRAWLRDWRWWGGLLAGTAVAAAHPLYYFSVAGQLSRLGETAGRSVGVSAWWVVLGEPNLGLVPNAPALAALVGLCAVVVLGRMAARRDGAIELAWSALLGVVFLVAFTRVGNINHGGTPGLSRYALWLVPLGAPWLVAGWAAGVRWRAAMTALALVSAAWSAWAFWPARPEAHVRPAPLAAWLWTSHPTWLDPPPEVFVERVSGSEDAWLPVSTPRCEKVLVVGRGDGKAESPWPAACPPVEVPATCRPAGALCYANLSDRGYRFRATSWPSLGFLFAAGSTWPERALAAAVTHARERGWSGLHPVRDADADRWLRASAGVASVDQFNAAEGSMFALRQVDAGARLSLRLPDRARATMVDAASGVTLLSSTVDAPPRELFALDVPGPSDFLLVILDFGPR